MNLFWTVLKNFNAKEQHKAQRRKEIHSFVILCAFAPLLVPLRKIFFNYIVPANRHWI